MRVDQTTFTRAMLDPTRDVPDGLVDPEGRSAGKRFNVYRNNVAVSLTEALISAFPSIHRTVGDKFFRAMAGVYLRKHPPTTPLMMFYGAEMPAFLAAFEPVQKLGYLPDLSRIDLARRQSYHAADSTAIDPAVLQSTAPDVLMNSQMTIAPSAQVVHSQWPIFSLWRTAMEGAEKPDMAAQDVLIARPEFDPVILLLPQGGAGFVTALQDGHTFGDAAAAAAAQHENFDLTTTLSSMLTGGVITGLTEGDDG